jgi:serine/threonine protein kinase
VGLPAVHLFSREGDFSLLVMERLGQSLEELLAGCGGRFGLKTTLMVADQLLCRMEAMHARNHIHRDIKPDNFVVGRGARGKLIYVIDLGLATLFRDSKTHRHVPFEGGQALTSSVRYMAVGAHLGERQSRRTDLESLGYTLLYFALGRLPWQGIASRANQKERYDKIREAKQALSSEQLCRGLPIEFAIFMTYVRALPFAARPDYEYLRRLFRDLFFGSGFEFDCVFDWTAAP